MATELGALFRRHPDSRTVLRHLAWLEQLLRVSAERAFAEAPLHLLKGALAQLETVVTHWDGPGLVALRLRLLHTLVEREALAHGQGGAPLISDFMDERRLQVSEASASDFAKAEAGWAAPEAKPD